MQISSFLWFALFIAGYITARWSLGTRLYELAVFAWDHGVVTRTAKGFIVLSLVFVVLVIPLERLAKHEATIITSTRYLCTRTTSQERIILIQDEHGNMVKNKNGLLRIFWPENLARTTTPGVMVGWRNAEHDVFVVTILEEAEVVNVESALRVGTLFRSSPYPVARIFQLCDRPAMYVLGTLNYPTTPHAFDASKLHMYSLAQSERLQVYCPAETGLSVQIIFFHRPNPRFLEYMSLEPINLALGDRSRSTNALSDENDEVELIEEQEKKRKEQLIAKLKYHTVIRHQRTQKETSLPVVLRQINCAQEVGELIQKNASLVGTRRKRSLSVSERVVESAQSLYAFAAWTLWSMFMTYVFPTVLYAFKLAIIAHRIAAEIVLQCLEWRLPIRAFQLPEPAGLALERYALKDISACAQQVHLRLQQFSYYPTQYSLLRKRNATWSSIPSANADYIRFYNSLWLVANDVIIGIAVGSFINDNARATSDLLADVLERYTIDGLRRVIRWLMSYPGGLKLNTELAAFLGDLFLWVIEYWSMTVTTLVVPHLPIIVYFIGFSSFAGASMPIALFSDLLSLLTIHIYSFYVASARIFNWQLTIIVSLFHLFRGKKRNVLRNRIDNCDYDLDQLLLGTILFTLLFFLLPTVIVFYLTFASARMAIISLKATFDTCLAFLNHFPLFAIMLLIKDPRRLPGGVHFKLLYNSPIALTRNPATIDGKAHDDDDEEQEEELPAQVSYIKLSSTPLSVQQVFTQYFQLGGRIQKHYLSPKVILRLLTGRFVPPLGRREMYGMQYSALPRERISISDVWKGMFEEKDSTQSSFGKGGRRRGRNASWDFLTESIRKRWK